MLDVDFDAVEREYCRRSLANFAKRAWHVLEPTAHLKWGWALDAICLHLEAVSDGRINRLLMNVPPGSMKSLLTGVIWPAWEWGPMGRPDMRYVGTAHEEQLAIRDSRKCRDLIKSEWYQKLWPLALDKSLDGKREFGNVKKGVRQARAFTSMTGVRGDRVILDDPLSADGANSDAKLDAVRTTFLETLPTRINADESAIVVIMQRLHEKDPSGIILDRGLPYVHLRIPMRFEVDRRCTTSIGWTDPRTQEGELMFPERFGEAQVAELEKTLGIYGTAGQLQQRPAPRGGGNIMTAMIGIVDAVPHGVVEWCRGWDLASTKDGDYTAGPKLGRLQDGRYIIADVVRAKMEPSSRDAMMLATVRRDGPQVKQSIPQDPGQAGVSQKAAIAKLLNGFNLHFSPESGSKEVRATPFTSQINAGNVIMLRAPWNQELLDEMASFPRGTYDDQVDGCSRAFNAMLRRKIGLFV